MPGLRERVAARQELDRRECERDPVVFLARHVQIEEPDGTVIDLELWPFQVKAVDALHHDRAVIVLKARRLGLSWIFLAYALWLAIFSQGIRILILCKNGPDAAELLDRIRRMRDRIADNPASVHLLADLPAGDSRDNVHTLDIGLSTIKALMGTPAAARSETAGLVLLDEFAFQGRAGEIWTAIYPTVEGGGRIGAVSTGNGPTGMTGHGAEFARQWSRASSGESEFVPLFFPWMARPDRDEAWKDRTIRALGDPDRFRKEYPEVEADAFVSPDVELVFDPAGVDAAERLGRALDAQLAAGTIPEPVGAAVQLGIDWGEQTTAMVLGWQLESGGLYVPPQELQLHKSEPAQATAQMLDRAARLPWPLDEARYDAAGAQSMRTFAAHSPQSVGIHRVAFSKRKREAVGYLRLLLARAAEGHGTKILAVSPTNTVLLTQMRSLEHKGDRDDIEKGNDHQVDALIALVSPIAARHRAATDDIE